MKLFRYETSLDNLYNEKVPIIFLAGNTVRGNQPHLTSWRIECVEEFTKQGFEGILVSPEFTVRTESDLGKGWIPRWEFTGLVNADAILFWIPRTRELIGLTTNYELGYWMGRNHEKVVYGRPDDAYRMSYPDIMNKVDAEDQGYDELPIYNTLSDTVAASIALAQKRFDAGVRKTTAIQYTNPYTYNKV